MKMMLVQRIGVLLIYFGLTKTSGDNCNWGVAGGTFVPTNVCSFSNDYLYNSTLSSTVKCNTTSIYEYGFKS